MEKIIGKWKVSKAMVFNQKTMKLELATWEEAQKILPKMGKRELQEYGMMFNALYDFTAEGKCISLLPIPESASKEDIDAAVAAGEIKLADIEGYFLDEAVKDWKVEDGKYLLDSGEHREVLGEVLSSFDEIKLEGDTMVLPMVELKRF